MREELLATRERFGIAVVMITHDPEDVRVLAKTVVIYEGGKVAAVGLSRDFREGIECVGSSVAAGRELRAKGAPPPSPSNWDPIFGAIFNGCNSQVRF